MGFGKIEVHHYVSGGLGDIEIYARKVSGVVILRWGKGA